MQGGTILIAATAIAMVLSTGPLPAGPANAADPHSAGATVDSARLGTDLYKGFRATRFLGSSVFSAKGEYVGEVRNIIISRDGQIESTVVEGSGATNEPDFIFRVPWDRLLLPVHTGALIANLSDSGARANMGSF
jgi:sporulation protein YlmC with PRC-barrel domain